MFYAENQFSRHSHSHTYIWNCRRYSTASHIETEWNSFAWRNCTQIVLPLEIHSTNESHTLLNANHWAICGWIQRNGMNGPPNGCCRRQCNCFYFIKLINCLSADVDFIQSSWNKLLEWKIIALCSMTPAQNMCITWLCCTGTCLSLRIRIAMNGFVQISWPVDTSAKRVDWTKSLSRV